MIVEKAAVLTRFAKTFLRFGHFEIHYMRDEKELLKQLLEHAFEVEAPSVLLSSEDFDTRVKLFADIVTRRQAKLMAEWLRVGYTQGNMNSDNTAVGGCTLDLGPFAFMEKYDRAFQPFTSDTSGLFSFANQPSAALAALKIFVDAVASVVSDASIREEMPASLDDAFREEFASCWQDVRSKKLGIPVVGGNSKDLDNLWFEMEDLMQGSQFGVDYTVVFANLASVSGESGVEDAWRVIMPAFYHNDFGDSCDISEEEERWKVWLTKYIERLSRNSEAEQLQRVKDMSCSNPRIIPRNWMIYEVYEGMNDDTINEVSTAAMKNLLRILEKPYKAPACGEDIDERFYGRTPKEYINMPGVSFLS